MLFFYRFAAGRLPPQPIAIKYIGDDEHEPERLFTRPESAGTQRAEAIGFGVALTRMVVFRTVSYPWFENFWVDEKTYWKGEDVDFCVKAREAGHVVYVDHDLSREVAHVGSFEYTIDHALAWEEEEKDGARHLHEPENGGSGLAQQDGPDEPDRGLHPAS